MKKFFKIILVAIGLIVGAFLVLAAPVWDDKTIVDSDLILESTTPINDTENAYFSLPKKTDLTDKEVMALGLMEDDGPISSRIATLTPAEQKQFIADTVNLVALFQVAANKLAYQCPGLFQKYSRAASYCDLNFLRKIATLVAVHSYYHGNNGNLVQATVLTKSVLGMGRLLHRQNESGGLIEYLVGTVLIELGVENIEGGVTHPLQMAEYKIQPTVLRNVLRREYMDTKAIMMEGFGSEPSARYWFQTNQTINDWADFTRADIKLVMVPCGETPDMTDVEAAFNKIKQPLGPRLFLGQNVKGNLLLQVVATGYGTGGGMRDRACALNDRLGK